MSNNYEKKFMGKQVFYDDKARKNVVSYYLMEDPVHQIYEIGRASCRERV